MTGHICPGCNAYISREKHVIITDDGVVFTVRPCNCGLISHSRLTYQEFASSRAAFEASHLASDQETAPLSHRRTGGAVSSGRAVS